MTPVCYTPVEVAAMLHVGRSKVFELIKTGQLGSVRIGHRRRILPSQLEEFLARLRDDAA
jgi:excisionase family DNA binding protein